MAPPTAPCASARSPSCARSRPSFRRSRRRSRSSWTSLPDVGLHVDLKLTTRLDELAVALRRFGLEERTVVSSSHVPSLRTVARAAPAVRIGFTYPEDRYGVSRRPALEPVLRAGARRAPGGRAAHPPAADRTRRGNRPDAPARAGDAALGRAGAHARGARPGVDGRRPGRPRARRRRRGRGRRHERSEDLRFDPHITDRSPLPTSPLDTLSPRCADWQQPLFFPAQSRFSSRWRRWRPPTRRHRPPRPRRRRPPSRLRRGRRRPPCPRNRGRS